MSASPSPDGRLCERKVDRGHGRWSSYQDCGRVAVGTGNKGEHLCKLHLRVDAKRAEKSAAFDARVVENRRLREEAERLQSLLGVSVHARFDWLASCYTDDYIVSGDWLRGVAEHGLPGPRR
jgi:hypothetical protein